MTEEETAKELIEKFYTVMPFEDHKLFIGSIDEKESLVEQMEKFTAKQCALICVNEMIETMLIFYPNAKQIELFKHYQKVKQIIESK